MELQNKNNMKFNSQICTTRSQSEALLKLGLKKETADMYYSYDIICAKPYYKVMEFMNGCVPEDIFPAWSLHRLLMMIDSDVQTDGRYVSLPNYGFVKNDNIYDNVIDCIEWLIKEGYFPKVYLV
jgi:hypothetical protein